MARTALVATVLDEYQYLYGHDPQLLVQAKDEHLEALRIFEEMIVAERAAPHRNPVLHALFKHIGPQMRALEWDHCWPWDGPLRAGYGVFHRYGWEYWAHRFVWCLAHDHTYGDLRLWYRKERLEVCHSCHVPACVNPNHLLLAPHRYNMEMSRRIGRFQRGGRSGR